MRTEYYYSSWVKTPPMPENEVPAFGRLCILQAPMSADAKGPVKRNYLSSSNPQLKRLAVVMPFMHAIRHITARWRPSSPNTTEMQMPPSLDCRSSRHTLPHLAGPYPKLCSIPERLVNCSLIHYKRILEVVEQGRKSPNSTERRTVNQPPFRS